ncbi:transmembrane protein 143-like [Ptychodera flava]|uniref:transmembrane protein 143-like n=1 Tax=Ptychodera flava TaxID=63121 RepID=UPI00396AAABD
MAAYSRLLGRGMLLARSSSGIARNLQATCLQSTRATFCSSTTSTPITTQQTASSSSEASTHPVMELPSEDSYRERFIPISRRSLMRNLLQEEKFLSESEKSKFEDFAIGLDTAITNHYHTVLMDLKTLFDPINPDKDTVATREWKRRERLDNEFWLLQKLGHVMEKANFHELAKAVVEAALNEHTAEEGVKVSVDPDRYDVLRYWALGRETPVIVHPWYTKLVKGAIKRYKKETEDKKPMDYYKRVVVAVRPKTEQKLILKMFKEVPVKALEQLLPDGKIKMTVLDKYILGTSIGLGALAVLIKTVSLMAHVQLQWTFLLMSVTAVIGIQAWTSYKNRHNRYLAQLSRMLYFKNVANNRGLLTLLVDRAEDELFKEVMLTYTFLLTQRPPSYLEQGGSAVSPTKPGGITSFALEQKVSDWVYEKTGANLEFDSSESNQLLQSYGILTEDEDHLLSVHPMDAALRNLPSRPPSLVTKVEEFDLDLEEGFERHYFDRENVYKEEEKRSEVETAAAREQ